MSVQSQIDLDTASVALKLEGPLNISSVEAMQAVLSQYASREPKLELDLSSVETCDAAGLQLLCSLRKSAELMGKPYRIAAASAQLTAVSTELGLPVESLTPVAGQANEDELPVALAAN